MATINDCPTQFRPALRTVNKGVSHIVDIIASLNVDFTPQERADRIAEIHTLMQEAVTKVETMLVSGTVDIEGQIDAVIAKPLE